MAAGMKFAIYAPWVIDHTLVFSLSRRVLTEVVSAERRKDSRSERGLEKGGQKYLDIKVVSEVTAQVHKNVNETTDSGGGIYTNVQTPMNVTKETIFARLHCM